MITPADDVIAATEWFNRSAVDSHTVNAMVPRGFAAYARVFHPAACRAGPVQVGERADASHWRDVSWADVAKANGRTMHGAAEWGQLTGSWRLESQECLWDEEPATGQTPERLALRLGEILARHTSTSEHCWFAVWEGWGDGHLNALHLFTEGTPAAEQAGLVQEWEAEQERLAEWGRYVRSAPLFRRPGRGYHLLRGPLSEIGRFYAPRAEAPSIWWPDDRAWCVGSDVDLMTTYLGGAAEAVEAVVADPELEALAIPEGQDVTWEADTVNPSVGPPS